MSDCRPKKDKIERTKWLNQCTGAVTDSNPGSCTQTSGAGDGATTTTLSPLSFTYVDKYWHEVRPPDKTIYNAQKKPKLITTYIAIPNGDNEDGEVQFINQEYQQQEYSYDPDTGISTPVFERQCIAEISYDEKYFFHIIEWPNSHTLESRPAGGFTATTTTSTSTGNGGAATTTTTTTYAVESQTVSGTFSLAKVDSELVDVPEGSVIYHGGTDDNKIFFFYTGTTNTVLAVGDVINGWTVSKVLNYDRVYAGSEQSFYVTKTVRKRISRTSEKNKTPSFVYINNNSAKSDVGKVAIGDKVLGKGIAKNTTVTNVEGNKITLSKALKRKKIRELRFQNTTTSDKVNETTLCYAELTGTGSLFLKDVDYTATGSGTQIKVVAGKGIISRSAVVGTYISNNKKEFRYTPLFYSLDNECELTITSDEYSEYVLGDIILDDGTELISSELLSTRPITNLAYNINNIYWTNFNRPVEQDMMTYWVSQFDDDILLLEKQIKEYETARLNGRKVSRAIDSECGNNLYQEYTKVYYPEQEFRTFTDSIVPLQTEVINDPCVDVKAPSAYTKDELSTIITSSISDTTSFSSIRLPDEMYKLIISNEDSLQNTLLNALDIVGASVPTATTIPNLPPQVRGDNKSSQIFSTEEVTRIPPRFKTLEYIIDDLSFFSDTELTPGSSDNIEIMKIRSIPRWTGNATCAGVTAAVVEPAGSGLRITTNKDSNNYVTSITVTGVSFNAGTSTENPLFPLNPTTSTKSWVSGSPYPTNIWHGADINYQQEFEKTCEFRLNEVTEYVTESVRTKGNPFTDNPIYARLTKTLSATDTTVEVETTEGFLSSGYLIIPKFIIKEEKNPETKNITENHYYLGEEIIYYRNKNSTKFLNCTRAMFDTTSSFTLSVNSGEIEAGVIYIIKTLGSVNWQSYGAPSGATVGTIFTATKDGSQTTETGEVTLFESTLTPFESAPDVNAVMHSYEKRNYLSQFWPIRVQNKTV